MKKNTIANILYIIFFGLLIFVDQITKVLAANNLKNSHSFDLIKDVLQFSYVENDGAAWGMMAGKQIFFIILTAVLFVVIVWLFFKTPTDKRHRALKIVLSVLAAGAIGNLIDRIAFNYVRDFIYFKLINFPVFNFADICVSLSMIFLVILILFVYKDKDFDFLKRSKSDDKVDSNE